MYFNFSAVSGYDLKVIPDEGVTVSSADENFAGIEKRIITGLTPGLFCEIRSDFSFILLVNTFFREGIFGCFKKPCWTRIRSSLQRGSEWKEKNA